MTIKGTNYSIDDGKICVSLYRVFFQREAVLAAAQKMTGRYYIEMNSLDSEQVGIFLEPKGKTNSVTDVAVLEEDAKAFCNEVLDQQVRLDLENCYGKIRELIVRQAFSPVSVDELSKELKRS